MKKIEFNDNKNIISKQLKIARVKAGLTQSQLAAKMQISNINIDQQMIPSVDNVTHVFECRISAMKALKCSRINKLFVALSALPRRKSGTQKSTTSRAGNFLLFRCVSLKPC